MTRLEHRKRAEDDCFTQLLITALTNSDGNALESAVAAVTAQQSCAQQARTFSNAFEMVKNCVVNARAPTSCDAVDGTAEAIYDLIPRMLPYICGKERCGPPVVLFFAKVVVLGVNGFCNPIFRWITRINEGGEAPMASNPVLEKYLLHSHTRARACALMRFYGLLTPPLLQTISKHVFKPMTACADPLAVAATWHFSRNVKGADSTTLLRILFTDVPAVCRYIRVDDVKAKVHWQLSARRAWITVLTPA